MNTKKNHFAAKQIRRVTIIGLVINILLAVLKLVVGALVSSMALIADGLHSLSDMATDIAVLVGTRFGAKQPDKDHPYGHGWAETFSTFFIGWVLIFAGGVMIYHAAESIATQKISSMGYTVLAVAITSIVAKEFSYQITKKAAVKLASTMLYANAWHHRSDALSSLALVLGVIASMAGFAYADQIATIIVGIMIIMVSIRIFSDSIAQFTARSVDSATQEQILGILSAHPQIHKWHKLRTRTIGREIFMDLHILVDQGLNIVEAHSIADSLEDQIHGKINQPVNITVHVEPDIEK